jgi:hypothetical protein
VLTPSRSLQLQLLQDGFFFQDGGLYSTELKYVHSIIRSFSECNSAYAGYGDISDRMVCAGDPVFVGGACQVTGS